MPSRFAEKYDASAARNDSLLCVGLDPDPALIPDGLEPVTFLRRVIEATSDLVAAYKPNAAFYEALPGGGFEALRTVIASVPQDIPVLLDAKRGDIGNTARFYARAVFEGLNADAVTVNPYLGLDALDPFLEYTDRHAFVLCRTSNPGARDFQDLEVGEGERLYERVARVCADLNASHGNVGMVVGATYPEEGARIRALAPEVAILAPGVGAQAGELAATVKAMLGADGRSLLVNASRGVLYAGQGRGDAGNYADAARAAADALRVAINDARSAAVG